MQREEPRLSFQDLAKVVGCSVALIRCAVDAGCPAPEARLSHSELFNWMINNYPKFRAVAGLPPLPVKVDVDLAHATHRATGYMLSTFADYMAAKATNQGLREGASALSASLRLKADSGTLEPY